MKKVKLLIVDDHSMIREGLRSILESNSSLYKFKIDEAESGEEGIQKVRKNNYDVVLIDYHLPSLNGAETTRIMLEHKPYLAILGLSNYDESIYIKNLIKAGAKGYMLKNVDSNDLIKAISSVLTGKNYYSNDVAVKLINTGLNSAKSLKYISDKKISEREIEVLQLINEAYTSQKIANKLHLSKRTVDKHRQMLLMKLQASNSIDLIKQAKKLHLIE